MTAGELRAPLALIAFSYCSRGTARRREGRRRQRLGVQRRAHKAIVLSFLLFPALVARPTFWILDAHQFDDTSVCHCSHSSPAQRHQ